MSDTTSDIPANTMQKLPLPVIAPSILSANFCRLEHEIHLAETGGAQWFHCDVMDGHFVPNITFGPMVVEAVRQCTDSFIDVHLMIEKPERYLADFANAGADLITVHLETSPHLHASITHIRKLGCKSAVAINPATPLSSISAILHEIDMVVLMSVNPGFGGQPYIESSMERLRALRLMRDELGASFYIQIDGGVTLQNATEIVSAGADVLVAGSSVFRSEDIPGTVKALQNAASNGYRNHLSGTA